MNHYSFHVCTFYAVLLLCTGAVPAAESDHETGMKFFEKGHYREAAVLLEKAFKANAANARVAFDYARVAPGSLAVAIYTDIATGKRGNDSLQAAAYGKLGDYSYVYSAFKTAAERYRKASMIEPGTPEYRHRWALAAAALHDDATARSLWHTITLEHGTDLARRAHYQIALLDIDEGKYDSAFARLDKAGSVHGKKAWTIAAAAAKLECAIKLGKKKEKKALEKELKPYRERLLEKDIVGLAAIRADKKSGVPVAAGSVAAGQPEGTRYTLQVGAFGSLDNATGLQKKLSKHFDEVTLLPVTLSDQVFYRVRIGTFKNKEAAEAFGKDSLAEAGVTFKAVVK